MDTKPKIVYYVGKKRKVIENEKINKGNFNVQAVLNRKPGTEKFISIFNPDLNRERNEKEVLEVFIDF